jgi:hypothetical protein
MEDTMSEEGMFSDSMLEMSWGQRARRYVDLVRAAGFGDRAAPSSACAEDGRPAVSEDGLYADHSGATCASAARCDSAGRNSLRHAEQFGRKVSCAGASA